MGYFCGQHLGDAIDHYSEHASHSKLTVELSPTYDGTCGKCNERGKYLVTYIPREVTA